MFKAIGLSTMALLMASNAFALEIVLPEPDKTGGVPVMEAMNMRHSQRAFSNEDLDNQTLSNILWAAYGVNSERGTRTIPTAKNDKDLSVYVARKDGVWLYNADKNAIEQVTESNILHLFNDPARPQKYMDNVPVVLIYTGSRGEHDYSVMHAGSAYQDVGLYAASFGLANVVRGYMDREAVASAIRLPANERVIISQAIGKPAPIPAEK